MIRITGVSAGTAEQPVAISYEGDSKRPYKPGKSMRRVLVAMWGAEGSAYVGKRLTLYCDPSVRFGGDEVGGIRISHADIPERMTIKLTAARGKRNPFTVDPLPAERSMSPQHTDAPACDLQTICDIGDSKAGEGLDALGAWWQSLQPTERTLIGKARLDAWKARAA